MSQLATIVWLALVSVALLRRGLRVLGLAGLAIGGCLLVGLTEGFATVVTWDPGALAHATPIGFLALSLWLAALGVRFAQARTAPPGACVRGVAPVQRLKARWRSDWRQARSMSSPELSPES